MNLSNKVPTTNCTWKVVPTYFVTFFLPDLLPFVHIHSFTCFYYQYSTHLKSLFSYSLNYITYGRCLDLHAQRCLVMLRLFSLFLPSTGLSMQLLNESAVQHCPTETPPCYTARPWPFSPCNSVPNILAPRFCGVGE